MSTRLVQERPARFLPGVDAARNVTGGGERRILRGLHRHGRALAEGAIEGDALAGGAGEVIEHAARPDIGDEIGVGACSEPAMTPCVLGRSTHVDVDMNFLAEAAGEENEELECIAAGVFLG
jgi:hypothetical protein